MVVLLCVYADELCGTRCVVVIWCCVVLDVWLCYGVYGLCWTRE